MLVSLIRNIERKNPILKDKLKSTFVSKTSFEYIKQTIFLSFIFSLTTFILILLIFKNFSLVFLLLNFIICLFIFSVAYLFFFKSIDVKMVQIRREIDSDLIFICEFFLISIESGMPIGVAIDKLSKTKRPSAKFFRMVSLDFRSGLSVGEAMIENRKYCVSPDLRKLLKKLYDSLKTGVEIKLILKNFIEEQSQLRLVRIKQYSKKLNPIITLYLLIGLVIPSLGITFFIISASFLQITPYLLKFILFICFFTMFLFQYFFYSTFSFGRETI